MDIVIHGHQADIPDDVRVRAEESVRKHASHLPRAVDADVRFDSDGVLKIVEIVLHAPRHTNLVAKGEGKQYGPALTDALEKLDAQILKLKSAEKKKRVDGIGMRA